MNEWHRKNPTHEDILEAKEQRAYLQAQLRSLHHAPVVSVTVNMPGSVKYDVDAVDLIYYALSKLRDHSRKQDCKILEERILHSWTGPVAILAMEGHAVAIKQLGILIEEERKYGRLLDIDVFDAQGRQINRSFLGLPERSCLLCAESAKTCRRSQTHHQDMVVAAATALMIAFRSEQLIDLPRPVVIIGNAALESMLMEVACTPAPGLVDRVHSGAHTDMDIFTFLKSSSSIHLAMHRCALAGWQHHGEPRELLPALRCIGKEAETEMFFATNGVNTQKGIIFVLGILVAAVSLVVRKQPPQLTAQDVLRMVADICEGIVQRELAPLRHADLGRQRTAGERLYLECAVTGIRGEMERGLPSVRTVGLPALRAALASGLSLNDALVHALIGLMAVTQDTTILHRHDVETLALVQSDAKSIWADGGMLTACGRERIQNLDTKYSENRVSPGGSADLVAATYFVHIIEERLK